MRSENASAKRRAITKARRENETEDCEWAGRQGRAGNVIVWPRVLEDRKKFSHFGKRKIVRELSTYVYQL